MKNTRNFVLSVYCAVLFVLASAPVGSAGIITPEINALLDSLDAELGAHDSRETAYLANISSLRDRLRDATGNEQRYWISHELYDAYSCFDSDSALAYAKKCYDLASLLGRRDWMNQMNLNRVYIYSATGLLSEAENCLAAVDTTQLKGKAMAEYYKTRLFFETHRDQFIGRNAQLIYQPEVDEFLTRLSRSLDEDDPDYFWLVGWYSIADTERSSRLRPKLEKNIAESKHNSIKNAKDDWMLSRVCLQTGDSIGMMRYLILSAISDTRSCNREIASLEELGAILYAQGDYERANSYLSFSIKCADSYKSRVRVGNLANLQDLVFNALNRTNSNQLQTMRHYLLWILLISIVLVIALIFIGIQLYQQKKTRKVLSDTKEKLEERVSELQSVRNQLEKTNSELSEMYETARESTRELAEVNDAKEKYITNIFAICSSYINKIDDFRKDIYRMIMAKRTDEVFNLVKSQELSHGEIKELYSNFDRIFLDIYPDFVKDFNTLLRPDEQISLKKGELLTTELRIYALVRLGMNDSVKIAQFLHCSVQTVYNTRQRTRNKAIVPKEHFAEAVRSLGKPVI